LVVSSVLSIARFEFVNELFPLATVVDFVAVTEETTAFLESDINHNKKMEKSQG
jgi:hypothetical protein